MFEVKVTVEIPGLPEAINALANAMSKTTAPAQAAPAAAPVAFMNTAPAQQITVPKPKHKTAIPIKYAAKRPRTAS